MSNDDTTPYNPLSSSDPTPEQGIDGLAEPPAGPPADPDGVPLPIDATQMMPVVPTLPAATPTPPPMFAESAHVPPASAAVPGGPTRSLPPESWYRKPGAAAGILLGFLVVAGIVAFLFLSNRGDDTADGVIEDVAPESVSLVVTRLASTGRPLSTSLSTTVTVQGSDAAAYRWVLPPDAVVGQAALKPTDATGRTEFRWAPSATADASTWGSTAEIAEFIEAEGEQSVTGLSAQCTLERGDSTDDIVVEAVATAADAQTTVGNYTFPNVRLTAGDRVSCTSTNVVADPAPVVSEPIASVPESIASVPESTTTAPETTTTVAETTTTVAETTTTTTSTTTTTTTTSTTLAPPVVPEIGAFLQGRPDLSEAAALLDRVGLVEELEASGQPFTIFVPTNDAIQTLRNSGSAPDFGDDDVVRALFGAHLVEGESLNGDAIAGRRSITVANGGPQPVDASGTPVRVGGVSLTQIDNAVDGGIVHVVGGVLPVQP